MIPKRLFQQMMRRPDPVGRLVDAGLRLYQRRQAMKSAAYEAAYEAQRQARSESHEDAGEMRTGNRHERLC